MRTLRKFVNLSQVLICLLSYVHMFNFVALKKLFLGRDENRRERFGYYVPVRETLKCLLESDLWLSCVSGVD